MNKNGSSLLSMVALSAFFLISFHHITFANQQIKQIFTTNSSSAKHYTIHPANQRIRIDGILNEEAWNQATVIPLLYEWSPGDNLSPPVKTECLVTFNKKFLYVAFRCFDPEPENIRAHLMDRDEMETFVLDDHVMFQIDTFNDERRSFQFHINPMGVQSDAIFSELEGDEDFSWDAIWDSAGKISDFGYSVEVAIPFNQLRFPKPKEPQIWGFSASRSYPRNVRHRILSHRKDRNKNCIICQFNKTTGFQGMSPGKNLEFDPSLTIIRTDSRDNYPDDPLESGKIKAESGITARWGITPSLILNATANPDFSHVEADAAQLEINSRFALRYFEKRPFFLEGADFFLTPLETVFTRTIFDPLWGMKMTGKLGKSALGFITTQDRYNNLIFPSNQGSDSTSLEEDVWNGILRYRHDIGRGSTLGMLYTGRTGDDYFNHVLGADGFFRFSEQTTLNLQYLHSETSYPNEISNNFLQPDERFGGDALKVNFDYYSRNIMIQTRYFNLGKAFRADSGFIPRVDYHGYETAILPVIWGDNVSWFDRIEFRLHAQRIENQEGLLTDQIIELGTGYEGPFQSYCFLAYQFKKEFYDGVTYDLQRSEFEFEVKPKGGVKLNLYGIIGDSIDYYNSRLAQSMTLDPVIDLSFGKHLNIKLHHIFERLSLGGEKIYTANLTQGRIVYNFNTRTFLRLIIQYQDLSRNSDLYTFPVDERKRMLFRQFLFSYKINPQTLLLIGYSDNHLGFPGVTDLTQLNRTFFLKIGYAFTM